MVGRSVVEMTARAWAALVSVAVLHAVSVTRSRRLGCEGAAYGAGSR